MHIGIDFDDVLVDANSSLARFHNRAYGTNYRREDVWTWHLDQLWGCSMEEAIRRVHAWYGSPEHDAIEPVQGARWAIADLAARHTLHLITSRPGAMTLRTTALLHKHFLPEHFAGLHFIGTEPGLGSKVDACKALGVACLVEDSLAHARDVAASGVPVVLFDCPWNREPLPHGVWRAYGWDDALDGIEHHAKPAP